MGRRRGRPADPSSRRKPGAPRFDLPQFLASSGERGSWPADRGCRRLCGLAAPPTSPAAPFPECTWGAPRAADGIEGRARSRRPGEGRDRRGVSPDQPPDGQPKQDREKREPDHFLGPVAGHLLPLGRPEHRDPIPLRSCLTWVNFRISRVSEALGPGRSGPRRFPEPARRSWRVPPRPSPKCTGAYRVQPKGRRAGQIPLS